MKSKYLSIYPYKYNFNMCTTSGNIALSGRNSCDSNDMRKLCIDFQLILFYNNYATLLYDETMILRYATNTIDMTFLSCVLAGR